MASKRPFEEEEKEVGDRPLAGASKRARLWLRSFGGVMAEQFLEPVIRRVVQEELQKIFNRVYPVPRPLCNRVQEVVRFRLHFQDRLPDTLFTGRKINTVDRMPIKVVIKDVNSDSIISSGTLSSIKIKIVVIDADFGADGHEDWTMEGFRNHMVFKRDGRRPLLTGGLSRLSNGVGFVDDASFTDNSSWTRSGKFRLGAMVSESSFHEGRVQEAITEAFKVKDCRVEANQKDGPLSLNDEVCCIKKIAKDGAFHKKLVEAGIKTVQEFLRFFVLDSKGLRNLLGKGMSKIMWEATIKHAKQCTLDNKLYSYCVPEHGFALIFNSIFELAGAKIDGHISALTDLTASQKNLVDTFKEVAYKNQSKIVEIHDTPTDTLLMCLPQMNGISIPGSSLSDLQISNLPDESPSQLCYHNQFSAPRDELSDDLFSQRDIPIACRVESIHLLPSFSNQGNFRDIVSSDHTKASFLMPPLQECDTTVIESSSSSQITGLPTHQAAPVGFQQEPCAPCNKHIGDHSDHYLAASFRCNSFDDPVMKDVWLAGLLQTPVGETSTNYGLALHSAPLVSRKWTKLIVVLKWISVKQSAARRTRIIHLRHQGVGS